MSSNQKTIFIRNLFKTAIGIVLLIASFSYLSSHPAEKIALYSGFKNIIQKTEIICYNLIGKNGALLEQKYNLENSYLDMLHFAEEKGCIDSGILQELRQKYETLLKEDKNQIQNYITKYSILASDYQNIIYGDCY
ncbi:MAG: hypothetical protein DLD55_06040 [candidate division SR1 bacterium]|nr:MAG: hypothetical protein DLD55_06040 [candidate division SR1 bacterium]